MGVRRYATEEAAREAKRVRNRIASKKRKAAAAIAAGREPGRPGGQVKYRTEEERRAASRRRTAEWRAANLVAAREKDAVRRRQKLAKKAVAEGRVPGVIGAVRRFTPEEQREKQRRIASRWNEKNPERRKELAHRYYLANKEKIAAKVRNRQLAKRAAGTFSPQDIRDLWEAQKGKCVFCLKGMRWGKFNIDHHVPLSRGGSNDRSNLRLLHPRCNGSKGARDPADHALRNGLLCW